MRISTNGGIKDVSVEFRHTDKMAAECRQLYVGIQQLSRRGCLHSSPKLTQACGVSVTLYCC